MPVDNLFSIWSALDIPDVNSDDGHIRFWKNLDDARFKHKDDIVKQMVGLEHIFDFIQGNVSICFFANEWDVYNFEVELGLW